MTRKFQGSAILINCSNDKFGCRNTVISHGDVCGVCLDRLREAEKQEKKSGSSASSKRRLRWYLKR